VKGGRVGSTVGAQHRDASTGRLLERHRPSGNDLTRVIAEVAEADPSEPSIKEIAAELSRRGRRTPAHESEL
jgi:hypothetical protein